MNAIFFAILGFVLGIGAPYLIMQALSGLRAWGLV